MCFNLPYTLKKGKFVIIRKGDDEDKEEIGLLVREIEKWNKEREKVSQGDEHALPPHTPSNLIP